MPYIICIILAFFSSVAQASDDWRYGVHALSFHGTTGYETVTPGVYAVSPDGWTVGAYRNSEARFSTYAGITLQEQGFALTLGAVTGYKRGNIIPLAIPSYKFDNGVRLAFIPNPWDKKASALHLAYEF